MFLFVEYIVEQEEWDRKFGLILITTLKDDSYSLLHFGHIAKDI